MRGAGPARERALAALARVAEGRPVADALKEAVGGLSRADRALCGQLVYGVLRHRRYLDAWMRPWLRSPITPTVADILRMGLFQLAFLDRVPAYAAVNAAVELAKEQAPRAAGLVNAVLRRAGQRPPEGLPLAVRYSHPDWMVDRWRNAFGARVEDILAQDNAIPPLTLRVRGGAEGVASVLRDVGEQGARAERSPYLPEAVRVDGAFWLEDSPRFRAGGVSVQDESGMLVAYVADPPPASVVLDLAAGLGGKSLHLLERDASLTVVAVDLAESRLSLLKANATRLHLAHRVTVVRDDARRFAREHEAAFSRVLLDAPCSGLGVLRRRVDARWKRRPEDLLALVILQRELIAAAWEAVAPGGALIYSTCSFEPEETDGQVAWAESTLPGLFVESVAPFLPHPALAAAVDRRVLRLFPGDFGMDGFFIARLVKREEASHAS